MEMSSNLRERPVTIGHADGRGFTGVHGDGRLSANGHANQTNWPGLISSEVTGADGSGFRGGDCAGGFNTAWVSARVYAATANTARAYSLGFRGVRTAP